tara:strand:- start:176 stop:391 length:216 start_codon:yes stop_codon:yes gene_type:complete
LKDLDKVLGGLEKLRLTNYNPMIEDEILKIRKAINKNNVNPVESLLNFYDKQNENTLINNKHLKNKFIKSN